MAIIVAVFHNCDGECLPQSASMDLNFQFSAENCQASKEKKK